MNGLPASRCPNCGTEFKNLSENSCPNCGRMRTEATITGFTDSGYYVKMKDGSEVGPVPLNTIAQMLGDGVIDNDTPIKDEQLGKIIFADEHPYLRGLTPDAKQKGSQAAQAQGRPSHSKATASQINSKTNKYIVIGTCIAAALITMITLLLKPSTFPSAGRAEQIETLSVTFTPPEENGPGGELVTRLIYSFRNNGPDPVIRIKGDFEIFRGGQMVKREERFILWSSPPDEGAVGKGGEFRANRFTSSVFPYIDGMDKITVYPTDAWSSEQEYETELESPGYR